MGYVLAFVAGVIGGAAAVIIWYVAYVTQLRKEKNTLQAWKRRLEANSADLARRANEVDTEKAQVAQAVAAFDAKRVQYKDLATENTTLKQDAFNLAVKVKKMERDHAAIVERHGTPCYVYSAGSLRSRLLSIRDAFAAWGPLVCFSVKSCSNLSVLRLLAESGSVQLATASGFLEQHPAQGVLALPESSWGMGGGHWTWDNPETHWMWQPIGDAERRMEEAAQAHLKSEDADVVAVLDQAARELLLLESSDWPFLVTTGQAKEYALQRFNSHLERFQELIGSVEAGQPDRALADELWEKDKVFPDVEYRWWAESGRRG